MIKFDPKEDTSSRYFSELPDSIRKIIEEDHRIEDYSLIQTYRAQYFRLSTTKTRESALKIRKFVNSNFPKTKIDNNNADVIFYGTNLNEKMTRFGRLPEKLKEKYKIALFSPSYKNLINKRFFSKKSDIHHPLEFIDEEIRNRLDNENKEILKKFEKRIEKIDKILDDYPKKKQDWKRVIDLSYKLLYPTTALYYLLWNKIINTMKPKILLFDDIFGSTSYPAILACKKNKIKSIVIQHGFGLPRSIKYEGEMENPDMMFVWGERAKREMSKKYKSDIYAIGSLKYDNLSMDKIKLDKNTKKLFWPAVFVPKMGWLNKKIFLELCSFLDKNDNWTLVIKSHPEWENPAWVKRNIKDRKIKLIGRKNDPFKVINSSDCVLAYDTTVFLEANVVGKPTVFYEQWGYLYELAKEYGFPIINDASNIGEEFEKNSKRIAIAQKKLVEDNISNLGKASEAAYEIIDKILSSGDK